MADSTTAANLSYFSLSGLGGMTPAFKASIKSSLGIDVDMGRNYVTHVSVGVEPDIFAQLDDGNKIAFQKLSDIARQMYETHADSYDLIFFMRDSRDITASQYHRSFDGQVPASWSPPGKQLTKLKGFVYLSSPVALMLGASLHEIGHIWMQYSVPTWGIRKGYAYDPNTDDYERDPDTGDYLPHMVIKTGNQDEEAGPHDDTGHWGISDANGEMGGFDRADLLVQNDEKGFYKIARGWAYNNTSGNKRNYSVPELWLMGLIPESDPIAAGYRLSVYTDITEVIEEVQEQYRDTKGAVTSYKIAYEDHLSKYMSENPVHVEDCDATGQVTRRLSEEATRAAAELPVADLMRSKRAIKAVKVPTYSELVEKYMKLDPVYAEYPDEDGQVRKHLIESATRMAAEARATEVVNARDPMGVAGDVDSGYVYKPVYLATGAVSFSAKKKSYTLSSLPKDPARGDGKKLSALCVLLTETGATRATSDSEVACQIMAMQSKQQLTWLSGRLLRRNGAVISDESLAIYNNYWFATGMRGEISLVFERP